MTTTATPPVSGRGANPLDVGDPRTSSRMWTLRLIGVLFVAGFVIYGTGSILVTSVVGGPDFLAGVGSQKSTLAIGAFLMIATVAVDIGKAVIFFPVLERHGKRTAVGATAEILGAPISLVLLIPGAIFDVTLAIWLLVKGFTPAAYDAAGATGPTSDSATG